MNQQNMAKAEKLFDQAYHRDPKLLTARMNQGIALLNMQKPAEAQRVLLEVVKQDPANTAAWYNLGLLSRSSNNTSDTIADFEHVLKLNPSDADAHYLLGTTYMQQNNYADAIPQLEQALRLNPLHASAEYSLARAHLRSGQADSAKQEFQRFQLITREKIGSPLTQVYGEMGRYSMAQSIHDANPQVGSMIPVRFVEQSIASEAFSNEKTPHQQCRGRWWLHAGY